MTRLSFPCWLGLAAAAVVFSPGCSCGSVVELAVGPSGGVTSGGGEGGGAGSSASGGGEGGQIMEASEGAPATELVSAGQVAKSPSYRMVFTLGQPTQNQGKTTSPRYRMQGGLVGANGSLP
jgi:hypothetical protein